MDLYKINKRHVLELFLNFGQSTEKVILNISPCIFKESIGCNVTLKLVF